MTPGMVVVGAGEAGTRTTTALRRAGWTGHVTLIGEEAAAPYERPPLSKKVLSGPASGDANGPQSPLIAEPQILADQGIELIRGVAVVRADPELQQVVLDDGRAIKYERLLIATGARPRSLPLDGALYLRTQYDAMRLRQRLHPGVRLCVIGGGLIGLEVAAAAASHGCQVFVIEAAPELMQRAVPKEVAQLIGNRHADAGVDLRLRTHVADVQRCGGEWLLTLSTDTVLKCDVVVAAVGAVPNTDLAAAAGLVVENGIQVDATLATSDSRIYAAGDCCSFTHPDYGRIRLESWRNAVDQAEVAAKNMLGGHETYRGTPWFWSDQYELTLQVVGLSAAATVQVTRRRADGVSIYFGLDELGMLRSAAAVGAGNSVAKDIRLAEMIIRSNITVDVDMLADDAVPLKRLATIRL